ncbi:MAG: ATP-binding protein [Acidimicrobiia bacterium]|nr:ATP-binding protein [Acidimicrobiia bacterium]
MTNQVDLVPTKLAVMAMRDNGYQNTAYAIAELIDNSLQAGATAVELLCRERRELVTKRERWTIEKIAVLDNGLGMNAETLQMALQFGNGTRLDDRSGIGRFGMGLPSASISQCKRVDVWTWQDSPEQALHSHIDLDEVAAGRQTGLPSPEANPLPKEWLTAGQTVGDSGTLVVWSRLDRCMWRSGTTIIDRSESIIGRMYRLFIHENRARIRLAAFDDPKAPRIARFAEANDPGYLIVPSSTPAPFDKDAMFEPDGDLWEETIPVEANGATHDVRLRFTIAKSEARNRPDGKDAGRIDYGRHAKLNMGVSIVRASRELELDLTLVDKSDTRERWWGVEIQFPPALDEVFGVTNNKQSARNLTSIAAHLDDLLDSENETEHEIVQRLREDGDPTAPLIEIVKAIDRRLRHLRSTIQVQRANARTGKRKTRYDSESAEVRASSATKDRKAEGKTGSSDLEEELPDEERIEAITQELVEEEGLNEEEARDIALDAIESHTKYIFTRFEGEGSSFFSVKSKAGEILIRVNTHHPAYENLIEVLDEVPDEGAPEADLLKRLIRARRGIKLLLMAWARLEDETLNANERRSLQDARNSWGTVALKFLENN